MNHVRNAHVHVKNRFMLANVFDTAHYALWLCTVCILVLLAQTAAQEACLGVSRHNNIA